MLKEYDFSNAKQEAVIPSKPNKTRITIRIDSNILNWFRHQANSMGGGSYQTLINNALQKYIEYQEKESIEDTLRRVIREELHNEELI